MILRLLLIAMEVAQIEGVSNAMASPQMRGVGQNSDIAPFSRPVPPTAQIFFATMEISAPIRGFMLL